MAGNAYWVNMAGTPPMQFAGSAGLGWSLLIRYREVKHGRNAADAAG